MGKTKNTEHRPSAASKPHSLAFRLSTGFFMRQLSIFLCMDLLLVLLAVSGSFLWAEHRCADAAQLVAERGVPTQEAMQWMAAGDYTITPLDRSPQGHTLPELGLGLIVSGEYTAQGLRNYDLFDHYTIELENGGTPYAVTVDMTGLAKLLSWGWIVLLGVQAFTLLTALFGSNRAIRRTLRPIQELAATAVRLNSNTHMSRQEMQALAGELEKINAKHLDSRIDLPATQKELRTLAQAINAMLDRVNKAYSAQMQFVSDASHELRTPIAVIQGYAALLDRWGKSDPETRQESIDAIRSEATAMQRLVEQLLFLARGDNDSQPVKKERFDLTELAAEVLRDEVLIHQERALLPSWESPVTVEADPALIKQVMRILMDNSVKYSPDDGRIWLRVSARDGVARVTVQDEGMGIPTQSLPHIFDRFYRTDTSRTRQTGGTGLGLAIARWIVERHGGWFELRSLEGAGTRISFLIPQKVVEKGGKAQPNVVE